MILDLNSEATIDKLELYLVSGHGLSTDWAVYGASGTSLNSSTTFEELSKQQQIGLTMEQILLQ